MRFSQADLQAFSYRDRSTDTVSRSKARRLALSFFIRREVLGGKVAQADWECDRSSAPLYDEA